MKDFECSDIGIPFKVAKGVIFEFEFNQNYESSPIRQNYKKIFDEHPDVFRNIKTHRKMVIKKLLENEE